MVQLKGPPGLISSTHTHRERAPEQVKQTAKLVQDAHSPAICAQGPAELKMMSSHLLNFKGFFYQEFGLVAFECLQVLCISLYCVETRFYSLCMQKATQPFHFAAVPSTIFNTQLLLIILEIWNFPSQSYFELPSPLT